VIKDQVEGTNHKLVSPDSLVGIYCVGEDAQFSDIEALQKSDTKKMDSSAYDVSWDTDKNAVSIAFNKDITIPTDGQYYVVIKTALTQYPFGTTSTYTYENSLYQKTATTNFAKVGDTVSQSITGKNATSKGAGTPFIFDGSYCWNADEPTKEHDTGNHTYKNYKKGGMASASWYGGYASYPWELTEPGTYLEYSISAFQNGYIQGDNITFSDTLPEGMELACLRNGWFNKGSASTDPTATNVDIEELNGNSDWTRVVEENKIDCGAKTKDGTEPKMIYYYNKKTREVRWRMTNVSVSYGANISFQLIVKITDEKVLLGVEKGSYTNQVKVYQDNKLIDKASCGPTQIGKKAMTKSIGDAGQTGNRLPFKIVVNLAGEDLLSGSSTITVVDELSSDLIVDIPSIKVVDGDGKDITDEITISMEKTEAKTYLKLTVPDNKKLTITYDTIINTTVGTKVSLSNVAHWEGYNAVADTTVSDDFSYTLEGMVSVSGPASLKLTKRDADNIMKTLEGATYSMQAATQNADGTYTLIGEVHTATTDAKGELIFSNESDDNEWLVYNTIYCLTEIEAPDGYQVDSTPQYILLASSNNTTEYSSDIQVERNSNVYDFEALDEVIPIPYLLPQTGGPGTHLFQITGFVFLTVATAGYVTRRKRKVRRSKIK
jgi:LPXTG-motif cell wall-anchored protein